MRESVFLSVKKVKRWPKSSFTHNFNIHTGEKNTAVGYGVYMFSEESSLPGAFYYLRYAGYVCFGSGGGYLDQFGSGHGVWFCFLKLYYEILFTL